MHRKQRTAFFFLLLAATLLTGCAGSLPARPNFEATLTEVATSQRQWTGVAVSRTGRIFVNYPRWSKAWGFSVEELLPNGKRRPFPDEIWNPAIGAPGLLPQEYFICVQSLYIDSADFLWVLDAANPRFEGVVPDGPKLVRIDLHTNRAVQVISIPEQAAPAGSYLNDVRIDLKAGTAYITDSGLGALIVTDIATGTSRRLLDNHPSVTAEGIVINVNGEAWRLPDGRIPEVHVDALALTPTGDFIYYQALSGKTLYRIPTAVLRQADLSAEEVEKAVQLVGQTCVADGIEFAANGYLYLTDVENSAIRRLRRDGSLEQVIQDVRLAWPDSLTTGADGALYVTTSQIHRHQGKEPYRLFRLLVRPVNP